MEAELSPPLFLRFALRPWPRLSLPLSLRGPVEPKGRYRAPQRGLRAWRFADIPTPLPIQNTTKEVFVMFSIHFFSASLVLDAPLSLALWFSRCPPDELWEPGWLRGSAYQK
jgi:hypothetical protein